MGILQIQKKVESMGAFACGPIRNIFSPPKPKPPPPVEVPSKEASAAELSEAAERDKQRRARQAGRASTILTKQVGTAGDDSAGVASRLLS